MIIKKCKSPGEREKEREAAREKGTKNRRKKKNTTHPV